MKNIKILSLFLLLAATQINVFAKSSNPELNLILAFKALQSLNMAVAFDNEDSRALKFIASMQQAINFDAQQKEIIAATQSSLFSKGAPINNETILQQNAELENRIDELEDHIKELQGSNKTMATAHKVKIKNRKESIKKLQQKIVNNIKAMQMNDNGGVAAINSLISANIANFQLAVENYIATFGQCYVHDSGATIVISSKHNKEMPITPNEFAQLIKVLNNGYNQFGPGVTINLNLANAAPANLKNVAGYINNMAPKGSSYATAAAYIGAAVVGAAALVGAGIVGYNSFEGKDWNDTAAASGAWNSGSAAAQEKWNSGYASAQAGWKSLSDYVSDAVANLNAPAAPVA